MQVSPEQLVNRRFFSGFSTITRRFSVGGAFIQAPHSPHKRRWAERPFTRETEKIENRETVNSMKMLL